MLSINGKTIEPGDGFRFGINRTPDGDDLVFWLRLEAARPVALSLDGRAGG